MKLFPRIILGFGIATICIAATGYGVVRAPYGKNLIRNSVAHFTTGTDYAVALGPIQGNLLSHFTIENITLSDAHGIWLSIDQLHLAWHPLDLIKGKRGIELLAADKIDLQRVPQTPEEPTEETASADPDIQKIFSYVPKNIDLKQIILDPAIIGMGLDAKILASGDAKNYQIQINTLDNSQTDFSSDILLQTDDFNIVRIQPGHLSLGATTLELSGQFDRSKNILDGKIAFNIPDLSQWAALAKTSITGDVHGELIAVGALNELKTSLTIASQSIATPDISLTATQLNDQSILDLTDLKKMGFASDGTLDTIIHQQNKPYHITSNYAVHGSVSKFDADLTSKIESPYGISNIHFTGNANIAETIFSGTIDTTMDHEKNHITLTAQGSADKEKITLTDLNLSGVGVMAKGNGEWLLEPALGTGNLSIDIPDMRPLTNMFGIPVIGKIKADAQFDTTNNQQQADITISALDVTYDKKNIRLKDSAIFSLKNQTVHLSPAIFNIAGGTIEANGDITPEKVDGTITIKQLDTTKIIEDDTIKGIVNGRIVLSGTPTEPLIDLKSTLKGISGTYPFDLTVDSNWQQGKLHLKANGKSQRATMELQSTLQTTLSLMPFKTDFSKDTALQGNLIANLPLEIFNPLLWASRQNISGTLNGKMALNGTVGTPQMNGKFNLSKVNYIHSPTGICVKNLNATILGSNNQVSITDLESKDSEGGKLKLNAKVALNDEKSLSAFVDFNHFKLFCGGLATGVIDGRLNAAGNIQNRMMVDGKLTLGPLNVQLPGAQNNQGIPEIETVRVTDKKETAKAPGIIGLNIILDAPNQIFIRGRGLDAEFGGRLDITGRARDPILTGEFKARRGRFTLFDRVLKLSNASLRFEGLIPPSPYLDINAETNVQSTTITIDLAGPAAKPKFALASQPGRPQDEVLALLLFGRQLQTISPFEALKLAQAARTLAGLDGGQPGILDKARATLGLDALDVGTDNDNNVTVSTGKYVTDKVYVGVQQGSEPADKQVKTEIELTPSISANTTIDAEGNQGFGLGWRHDY